MGERVDRSEVSTIRVSGWIQAQLTRVPERWLAAAPLIHPLTRMVLTPPLTPVSLMSLPAS
jgi:hypothetical protein